MPFQASSYATSSSSPPFASLTSTITPVTSPSVTPCSSPTTPTTPNTPTTPTITTAPLKNFRKFASQFTDDFLWKLKQDILDLIKSSSTETESFQKFLKERWNPKDLSLLHGIGLSTHSSNKIYDFIFAILLENFKSNKRETVYAIFSFYFSAPLPPSPVRMEDGSLSVIVRRPIHLSITELNDLFEYVKTQSSNDVKQCFTELWKENAFLLVEPCLPSVQLLSSTVVEEVGMECERVSVERKDIIHDGSILSTADTYASMLLRNCCPSSAGGANDFFSHKLKMLLNQLEE